MMSLGRRLRKLEIAQEAESCVRCGARPSDSTAFSVDTGGPSWAGYPEPLLCDCGGVLRFTLRLGDVENAAAS